MAGLALTANGDSDWIPLMRGRNYRIDVTAATWGGSTSVKLKTASESGLPIVIKDSDGTTDLAFTANGGTVIAGPGRVLALVASVAGSSGLNIVVEPTD